MKLREFLMVQLIGNRSRPRRRLVVGGEVDDEGVIRKICVVPKPYQQPHQPMFQPFSVSEATIRYTAQSDIVPVILTAYPPRLRPFRGSLPTLRWRETDSNFRFRAR
jgi:hypothetical protein